MIFIHFMFLDYLWLEIFWYISTCFDFYRKSLRICQKWPFSSSKRGSKGQFRCFPKYHSQNRLVGVHILQFQGQILLFLDFFPLTPLIITFYCVFRVQGFQIVQFSFKVQTFCILNLSNIQTFFINFWPKFLKLTVVKGTSSVLFQKVEFLTFLWYF